jgi:hypothetical protein
MEFEDNPPEVDASHAVTDASLNAVLAAAQEQLRTVLEEATSTARHDVKAAAAEVAAREAEIENLRATVLAEHVSLDAQRAALENQITITDELRRAAEAQTAEAKELNHRATKSLADALERSAQVVEEAEARVQADEEKSKARIERDLHDAKLRAAEIHTQAARRLEAVGVESEAMLQRAVERGHAIVETATSSAKQSKADLLELVKRIQEYLDTEVTPAIDLDAALAIDVRSEVEPVEAESGTVTLFPGRVDASSESDDEPRPFEAVADETAMEAYFNPSVAAGDDAVEEGEDAEEATPDERVADAVRRAVRSWGSTRQEAQ